MSYEEGAMIEPLAVAVHGVKQMGDVAGMNIAVLGAGPIGNLVAQTAKGMGAAKVMITDISDLRLAKAKECEYDWKNICSAAIRAIRWFSLFSLNFCCKNVEEQM